MTEIYLIRHAQAEGNRYHMMQGHWDGGVTALGRRQIEELAELSDAARALLVRATEKYALSMRGYTRLIKVARTIADLRGDAEISAPAMAEAIQYRMLDAKYWNR